MATNTGNTYTLGSVVQDAVDKNVRMFPILYKQFKHLQYAFFDVEQLAGMKGFTMKPKEISGIDSTLTVDGTSVKWMDYSLTDYSAKVAADVTETVTAGAIQITFGAANATAGYSVNDTVYSVKLGAGDEFDGVVKSIDSGTDMTIELKSVNRSTIIPATVDVVADQIIVRGFWRRNDNDEVLRSSSSYGYVEHVSNLQHFSRRIEFTKAELNKVYEYEKDAKDQAQKRFMFNLGILFQEVNAAIYKGKNSAAGAGALEKMEMLGLESIAMETGAVTDLGSSTSKVKDLMSVLEKSFRTGAVTGSDPMMLICNDAFISNLAAEEGDKVRYDKTVDQLKYQLPTVSTVFGEVDIVRDPVLNRLYSYPVAYTVPRSLVKLVTRENQSFNPKGGITRADQSISLYPVVHNLREKELYDISFELGMVAGGMSSEDSPYRMITNF